jgi:uncharacterized protein (UPF0332 family)
VTAALDVQALLDDARYMYSSAVERLDQNDIRDAAEKAWCATLQATNALILARRGVLPARTPETSRMLNDIRHSDDRLDNLVGRYYTRQGHLHGECFYLGLCSPEEETERRIRETVDYIAEVEELIGLRS